MFYYYFIKLQIFSLYKMVYGHHSKDTRRIFHEVVKISIVGNQMAGLSPTDQ
jgi:Holliday junction resolvasome RuvABC DNA-binding subunit